MLILSICIGLCMGSFIHVAYCRFSPQILSAPYGVLYYFWDITCSRSCCPCCHKKLTYWQLIPVISWFFLRARCYHCQSKIALSYLAIEIITAGLFTIILFDKGLTRDSILLLLLAFWFILLALIDFRYYLLPDFLTQPLMWLGLFLSYWEITKLSLDMALTGVFIGYFLLKIPATLFYFVTRKNGLGHGDIKLIAALGAWVPYFQLPLVVIIASLLGIIYFIFARYGLKNKSLTFIPFGPFLLIASYLVLYFCQ